MNRETTLPPAAGEKIRALPAWKVLLAMVRFKPRWWIIDLLSALIFRLALQLAPGLYIQSFFDMVTGDAKTGFTIWTIIAFIIAALAARILGSYGFVYADVPLFSETSLLMRRNLMKNILRRPGASPLPDSPGEAVSRFRNDVVEVPTFILWINDVMIGIAITLVSITLIVKVSLPVTLMAILPLIVTGVIASITSGRVSNYRRASRQATGKVTGFIG